MPDEVNDRVENTTKTSDKGSESAAKEADEGKGELVGKQKAETERLKAGGSSGITAEHGKVELFDSKAVKAAVADFMPFGDQEIAYKVPHKQPAGGEVQPQGDQGNQVPLGDVQPTGDQTPATGDVQRDVGDKQAGPGKQVEQEQGLDVQYHKDIKMTEVTFPEDTSVTIDDKGNKTVSLPGGASLKYNAEDGSITHTTKDGTEVTVPKGGGPVTTMDENGTQAMVKPDGSIVVLTGKGERTEFDTDNKITHYDRGAKEIGKTYVDSNGSVMTDKPDGSWSEKKTDGTLIEHDKQSGDHKTTLPDNTKVTQHKDGSTEVQLPDGKQTLRINPDKSVTIETKHSDGSATSTTTPEGGIHASTDKGSQARVDSDGKVVVVDKDGNRTEFYHPGNIVRRFDPSAKELP